MLFNALCAFLRNSLNADIFAIRFTVYQQTLHNTCKIIKIKGNAQNIKEY